MEKLGGTFVLLKELVAHKLRTRLPSRVFNEERRTSKSWNFRKEPKERSLFSELARTPQSEIIAPPTITNLIKVSS